jgi:hypothetical protein
MIRKRYGPIKQEERWRIRNTEEIGEILKKEDIVRFIKARRIGWLGHVEGMNANRITRKILHEIYTKRVRGRPKIEVM